MNIGLDAKRYFHNSTGLGNYSRTLVNGMAEIFPEHDFFLFNPKPSVKYRKPPLPNIHEIQPEGFPSSMLTSMWRSNLVKKDLARLHVDLYHGLSHEIPVGIAKTGIPSVVTIHDLIFERYPEQFKKIDVQIYRRKFKYACHNANRIIVISKQTREDIINLYGIAEDKIDICYQSCHPAFSNRASEDEKQEISHQYSLPPRYFLNVGSIIERKNLLNICKAIKLLEGKVDVPLVVIGDGKKYKEEVKQYIKQENLSEKIIFLSEQANVNSKYDLHKPETLSVIYQMS
ncbi:MAG TPA: glycosyltransferase family 1 protein, partial [Chitinophagaceae bacterium]